MAEKRDCIYYKKRKLRDKSSYGTIAVPADIIEIPYCVNPKISNQLGHLPCEKCQYYEKESKKN